MPVIKKKTMDPLQKRIPKNPRYADIEASIDTGASLTSYLKRLDEACENFKVKPGEIFRRMRMTTFIQLVIQVAEVNGIGRQYDKSDDIPEDNSLEDNNCASSVRTSGLVRPLSSYRSTLESVINGIGEVDLNNSGAQESQSPNGVLYDGAQRPYLLLDVREKDDYDQCHIIQALNYPSTMLSRCMNFETREMLAFRNKPGHIIIFYDEDERLAPRVATMLTERGYENAFILSGGLKVAWKLFPKGLILGDAPPTLRPKPGKRPLHEKDILRLSSSSTMSSSCSVAHLDDCASTVSGRASSTTSSVRRAMRYTFDTYEPVGARGTPNGGEEFAMLDLAHLSLAMDGLNATGRLNTTARTKTTTPGSVCSRTSRTSTLKNFK